MFLQKFRWAFPYKANDGLCYAYNFNQALFLIWQDSNSKVKAPDKEGSTRTKQWKEGKYLTGKQSSPEGLSSIKVPKGLKSFSHELGPKGGIPPSHPRAHSYNDLKVSL